MTREQWVEEHKLIHWEGGPLDISQELRDAMAFADATCRDVVMRHRRHVELSPGVGKFAQTLALAVCDDILNDLTVDATRQEDGAGRSVAVDSRL